LTNPVEFWDLGHKLFRSTPETFPVPFIMGDVFDTSNVEPVTPFNDAPETPLPTLNSLISLNPLRGHVSAIHASSLFHLFDEDKQIKLARALACLLSPQPGSVIFGSHAGRPVAGMRVNSTGGLRFTDSPESWGELWDGRIFDHGKVKVEASLQRVDRIVPSMSDNVSEHFLLVWSVTRM
jgi:hypothetical protein